jgi:hypothetical protein
MPTYVKILFVIGGFIIISAVAPVMGWSLRGVTNSVGVTSTDAQGSEHTVASRNLDSEKLSRDALNGRISTQEDAYVKKEPWWTGLLGDSDEAKKPTVRKGGFGSGSRCKSGSGAKFCSSGG